MTTIFQDAIQPDGGAERVFEVLRQQSWISRSVIGLGIDSAQMGRVLFEGKDAEGNVHRALRGLLAATIALDPPMGRALLLHHHSALIVPCDVPKSVAYLHTPTRVLWEPHLAPEEHGALASEEVTCLQSVEVERVRDLKAIATNSGATQERIERHYGRRPVVIYPPAGLQEIAAISVSALPELPISYLLTCSRLVISKKIDRLIDLSSRLRMVLVVVGSGRDRDRLEKLPNTQFVIFTGRVPDGELRWLIQNAAAYVSSVSDDFGIAVAEALAEGVPVVVPATSGVVELMDESQGTIYFENILGSLDRAVDVALGIGKVPSARSTFLREILSPKSFSQSIKKLMYGDPRA